MLRTYIFLQFYMCYKKKFFIPKYVFYIFMLKMNQPWNFWDNLVEAIHGLSTPCWNICHIKGQVASISSKSATNFFSDYWRSSSSKPTHFHLDLHQYAHILRNLSRVGRKIAHSKASHLNIKPFRRFLIPCRRPKESMRSCWRVYVCVCVCVRACVTPWLVNTISQEVEVAWTSNLVCR